MSGLEPMDALDGLVAQFADPLACLRELVQNAVDAGSNEVDIRFEYTDDALVLHVVDYGCGMDRADIDERLTRLFATGKDGDLTRIGKFGIGFVSVFALEPDAVCVDTWKDGACWRVLFRRDRSFQRLARDAPGEGTHVRLIKSMTVAAYTELRARAREVVRFWCRYLEPRVALDGTPINEPFGLDAEVTVVEHVGDARVVVGYRSAGGSEGFFNKGLTLLERVHDHPELSGVSFRVDARGLEHTLTRDNVLHDGTYLGVMEAVRRIARDALPQRLVERLHEATPDERETLYAAAPPGLSVPLFDFSGAAIQPASLRRTEVLWAEAPTRLALALVAAGRVVLDVRGPATRGALWRIIDPLPAPVHERFTLAFPLDAPHATTPLTEALSRLLRRPVVAAVVEGRGGPIVAIRGDGPTPLDVPIHEADRVALDVHDDAAKAAAKLPPAAGAYLLAKPLLRPTRLEDGALLRRVVEQTWPTR